jgi:hypothetical protein
MRARFLEVAEFGSRLSFEAAIVSDWSVTSKDAQGVLARPKLPVIRFMFECPSVSPRPLASENAEVWSLLAARSSSADFDTLDLLLVNGRRRGGGMTLSISSMGEGRSKTLGNWQSWTGLLVIGLRKSNSTSSAPNMRVSNGVAGDRNL